MWTLTNALAGASKDQVVAIVDTGLLQVFADMLDINEVKLQCVVLEAVAAILETGKGEGENRAAAEFDAVGGLRGVEKLQSHANPQLAQLAVEIMENFYSSEIELAARQKH